MRREREIYTIIDDNGHPFTYGSSKSCANSYFLDPVNDDSLLLSDMDPDKADEVLKLLRGWFEKSSKTSLRHTSYGMKHWVEDVICEYFSNNQLKDAMLTLGFEPSNWYELNWCFKVKPTEELKEFLEKTGRHW